MAVPLRQAACEAVHSRGMPVTTCSKMHCPMHHTRCSRHVSCFKCSTAAAAPQPRAVKILLQSHLQQLVYW